MNIIQKRDDGKQARAQSKDFNETRNTHTDLNVEKERWDEIFHNYQDPKNCSGSQRPEGCTICNKLRTDGYFIHKSGKVYSTQIAIIGDLHSDYKNLEKFIEEHPYLKAIVVTGDLALWRNIDNAQEDKKAFSKTAENIEAFILEKPKFKIPIYVVKGNHDDYNNMYSSWFNASNIFYLKQGEVLEFDNAKIGCIGGVYSSKRSYLQSENFVNREHRFYTIHEIEDLILKDFNILITHQASAEILPNEYFENDEGSKDFKILLDIKNPKYYFHGHHHKNYTSEYNSTKIFGLGNFSKTYDSYVIINTLTNEVII